MDAVLGFLDNPVVLTIITVGWGLLIKYAPQFSKWPNALIPYLNALLTLLIKLGAPADAHAAGWFTPVGGFLGPVLAAGWQAIMSSLVYEVFLRTGTSKVLMKNSEVPSGR